MALLGREFIAVPDDRKGQIVFKWPDITIRRFTRAIVNADEMAMFVNTGQVVQTLGPGRHQIAAHHPPHSTRGTDHGAKAAVHHTTRQPAPPRPPRRPKTATPAPPPLGAQTTPTAGRNAGRPELTCDETIRRPRLGRTDSF